MQTNEAPWVEGKTIGQVLQSTSARLGDREALVFPQRNYRRSWGRFAEEVEVVARGLVGLGFKQGDHFAVWCTNQPEWLLLQFATARIGVVLVTVNPAYRSQELEYVLKQSDVKGLALIDRFKGSDYAAILEEACPELLDRRPEEWKSECFPKLRWIVSLAATKRPYMLGWDELLAGGRLIADDEAVVAASGMKPNDKINLQYTSGTTGFPKGALLSHQNLLLNVFYAGRNMRLTDQDRVCIPVPLYHCFGCVLGSMLCVVHGATMVFPHEHFDPEKTLDAVEKERCTAVYGVPTMFIAELEHPTFPGRDLSSLRTGIMAGSPCPLEVMRRVTGEMGAHEMTIGYGQTEASPLLTQTRFDDPIELRVGTVGKALPGVEIFLYDVATNATAPDGIPGELCGRGHPVMLGYYNNPDATSRAIDGNGWLHTGDLAICESNGYYRITGRLKDMIIRGGENIYPREVEECLYRHPAVEEVQVVGVPDVRYGEEILAWIKLRAGAAAEVEAIRAFCKQKLAHFKTPRYVKFVAEFPMTVTGKIQKYRIREEGIRELGLEQAAAVETA